MRDSIHRPRPETRTVGESDGYVAAAFVFPIRFTDRSRRLAPWVRVVGTWRLRSYSRFDSTSASGAAARGGGGWGGGGVGVFARLGSPAVARGVGAGGRGGGAGG